MTWKFALFPFALLGIAQPALAQEEIFAITEPVALNPDDPETEQVGELIYRGGVVIEPGDEGIGGISGLAWDEADGLLYAVSDDGHWLTIEPDEIDGQLIDILGITRGDLNDERGRRLRGDDKVDAQAIARDEDGGWLVAFEREHRIWRYADLTGAAAQTTEEWLSLEGDKLDETGVEALAMNGISKVRCMETPAQRGAFNCLAFLGDTIILGLTVTSVEMLEQRAKPSGAACHSDKTCFVVLRSFAEDNRAAIVELTEEGSRTLAVLAPPLTNADFSGIAVRGQFGKTFLYIVSDNDFSDDQGTLLMKFEIRKDEPMIAANPEPEVNYETTDVVLETDMGEITIRLETERAPITAANFLRYIDEDRFDGTVFYRAMKLEREPMPNGLVQGGTRFDPARILPGIPHEPTTLTGLSHTNGAVSMAMGDPGTANGDFSIMLADQIGLDARPEEEEPIWQNGYAVFGYVIDGMDVVSAIHASPTDPDKGEGALIGQIIAAPVTIIDARRVAEDGDTGP